MTAGIVLAGIVLAAGRSSRLGRPKQLVLLHGEPLLRRTLQAILTSRLDPVIVVLGHEAEAVTATIADLPVTVVLNPDFALGQSTSLRVGLAALFPDTAAAMVLLGDQPGIRPETIGAIVAAWDRTPAPVVAPHYQDGIGNPVLFDRIVFPELLTVEGDTGAKSIVQAHQRAGDLLLVPVNHPAPRDVDTEADLDGLQSSDFPPTSQQTIQRRRYGQNTSRRGTGTASRVTISPSPCAQGEGLG